MGIAEGAITPGFMLLTSMFYTRAEQTRRVGYWCELFLGQIFSCLSNGTFTVLMNGIAIIILGFIAFGVVHTTDENFEPWQWYA